MATVIRVDLGPRAYDIVVERGALATLGRRLRGLGVGARAALVTAPAIGEVYGKTVLGSLEDAGFAVTSIQVPDGETAKTLTVAGRCWDALIEAGLDRTSVVVALGGGAVGDVAGFVSATYMRGTHFVQVPTTVLAQVDASSGGKTAVNHRRAKNLIGAFHQPRLVLVDPETLTTLPEREFRSGLAEIVKHGIVLDAAYFEDVERSAAALLAREGATLERVIAGSCRLKAAVVQRDEREAELRHVLNYGHTIGHALEAATGYERWAHGEAVALGIVAEARLAERLGLATRATVERQERLLAAVGLPTRAGDVDAGAVLGAMARDKKARDGRVPFVLAPAIGSFRLVHDVPAADVRAVIDGLTR
ncbi:MAG: 3-dehydroquinate synthase [Candidatus Rokuibacteriota bacterium]